MRTIQKRVLAIGAFILLLWLFPNLVHEPLHLVALKLQGLEGTINFDWSFPPAPSTTKGAGALSGVFGGMLYLMLPALISVVLLVIIGMTHKSASLLTHVVLPTYLTFDLIMNVLGFRLPTSDFRWLQALPYTWFVGIIVLVLFVGLFVMFSGFMHEFHKKCILCEVHHE